jgi:lipopolysaccharide biosynthesis protein
MSADVRVIPFYLPQFHPIPENDKWWGPGFTEWTNVTRGRPMFTGHYQPRRPGELGYYDLRVREVRHRQVELARAYGIHGFCYYYYWFSGRRLLERPLDLMLADRNLDFPFCVCWANENWTRRWDGSEQDVLIEQKHLPDDPARFIRDLAPVLRDHRYITVNGAPLLLVYRPAIVPDLANVLRVWRHTAEELGVPRLHLCALKSFGYASGLDDGFDAMVEFPPQSVPDPDVTPQTPGVLPQFKGKICSYPDLVRYSAGLRTGIGLPVYRGVMPGWDNTARRDVNSHIYDGATPELYEVWLRRLLDYTRRHHQGDHRLLFVNAWNEWAEGTYLEPDEKFGYRFLEATARAVFGVPAPAALIAILRQIHTANEEAASVLDQLEHAVRINEQIVNLIDAKAIATLGASRDAFSGSFHPLTRSPVRPPLEMRSNSVLGQLDVLNTPNFRGCVTLDRAYDVLIAGWIASRRVNVDSSSPVLFQFTNVDSHSSFLARVPSRMRREDVAKHLKDRAQYRRASDAWTLYSGYRAYLNISALEPGPYTLDAIVPTPDGNSGVIMRLHSSVVVL